MRNASHETDPAQPTLEFVCGALPPWMQHLLLRAYPNSGTPWVAFQSLMSKLGLKLKTADDQMCYGSIVSAKDIAWSYWAVNFDTKLRGRLDRMSKVLGMPYSIMAAPPASHPYAVAVFAPKDMRLAMHEHAACN